MRILLALIVFTLTFHGKGNANVDHSPEKFFVPKTTQTQTIVTRASDILKQSSPGNNEIKKGINANSRYIFHLFSRFSYWPVEAREFLDTFFLSFLAYHLLHSIDTKVFYLRHHIRTGRALKIIYPYHSFW